MQIIRFCNLQLLNALHTLEVAYEEALFEIERLKEKIDHYENVVKY